MMKRYSAHLREESFEHVLMCLICRSLFDEQEHQPKFLPCHHTFCKDCLREYIRQSGDEIECPSCRKIATIPAAGVSALQTNFYVKYIHNLVRGGGATGSPGAEVPRCAKHEPLRQPISQFCKTCNSSICKQCVADSCADHDRVPIAAVTEESHQKLDYEFEKCNSVIEAKKTELEAIMKALSLEKDEALKQIEATFEQHIHTLNRRATLLKNKVIDIYNDHARNLDCDMEEISTALTCIISLKEYHEEMIGKGNFHSVDQGLAEIEEVYQNISQQICPTETHIIFEEKHGIDKFKTICKDLGRVTSSHPMKTRAEPIGGHDTSDPAVHIVEGQSSGSEESPLPEELGACGGQELAHEAKSVMQNPTLAADCCKGAKNKHHSDENPALQDASSQGIDHNGHMHSGTDTGHPAARPTSLNPSRSLRMGSSKAKSKVHPNSVWTTSLQHSKPSHSGQMRHLTGSAKINSYLHGRLPPMPDVETIRQSDKMYHHLVYTSYDEDELLRELRGAGKVVYTDKTDTKHMAAAATESDSWQTTSSCDELTASLGDDAQQTAL